jgi:hypothetical protein
MPATTTHNITISPAFDHRGERLAGRFNARLGNIVLVRGVASPFHDAACKMLKDGLAQAEDVIELRHRGSDHVILKGTVGNAAKMATVKPRPALAAR